MSSPREDFDLLNSIRYSNELRLVRAREQVGGVYFLIALGMTIYCIALAVIQSWLIPTRRIQRFLPTGAKAETGAMLHWLLLTIAYFAIVAAGGLSGYIVMTGLYFVAFIVQLIFALYYRHKSLKQSTGGGRATDAAREVMQGMEDDAVETEDPTAPIGGRSVVSEGRPGSSSGGGGDGEEDVDDIFHSGIVPDPRGGDGKLIRTEFNVMHQPDVPPGEILSESMSPQRGRAVSQMAVEVANDDGGDSEGSPVSSPHRASGDGSPTQNRQHSNTKHIPFVDSCDAASTSWTYFPRVITNSQLRAVAIGWILILVIFIIICFVVFLAPVQPYRVVDHAGTTSVIEHQPKLTAKALVLMYAFPAVATNLRLEIYVELLTDYCGKSFTKYLHTDEERRKLIHEKWIEEYSINMSMFTPSEYSNYSSVNAWFTRNIRLELRPLPFSNAVFASVMSPADCRMLIFESTLGSAVWVKDSVVSARVLTGGLENDYWAGGSMVIARLAGQDYHHFHAPVAGQILAIVELGHTQWSVSADAARSDNFAFLNNRKVIVIDGGLLVGKVAYVAIGATCVGSVELRHGDGSPLRVGDFVDPGEELGQMQFGGSTVVMLFGRGRVAFDPALIQRSQFPVETLVHVRSRIGGFGIDSEEYNN